MCFQPLFNFRYHLLRRCFTELAVHALTGLLHDGKFAAPTDGFGEELLALLYVHERGVGNFRLAVTQHVRVGREAVGNSLLRVIEEGLGFAHSTLIRIDNATGLPVFLGCVNTL